MISGYKNTTALVSGKSPIALGDLFPALEEDLQPLFNEINPLLDKIVKGSLQGYYDIGRAFKVHGERIENQRREQGKTSYGTQLYVQMGVALDIHDRVLRECHRAADCFTPEEYQNLVIANDLTWGHAKSLARVADAKRRQQLVKEIVEKRMSVEDLLSIIRSEQPKKPRGPGRAPAMPKNLQQALTKLQKLSTSYCNAMQQVLFGDIFDIPKAIEAAPPDVLTAEIREIVANCSAQLAMIEKTSQDACKRLQASLEHIDGVIAAQKAFQESNPPDDGNIRDQKPRRQLACAT